jgi:transposase-like protein
MEINTMNAPTTLQQAIAYFSDAERCFRYAISLRWPDGNIACPRCGSEKYSFISTRRIWFCKGCKKQFTVKVGTIFEDSAIGMDKWLTAVWLVVNCKNGISSYEIARHLGVTQKTGWFMAHRIRKALQSNSFVKLGGPGTEVEVDETFIGGKSRNMHLEKRKRIIVGPGPAGKATVMGFLERGGQVQTVVVPNIRKKNLQPEVHKRVVEGTTVYTDALGSYDELYRKYQHAVVDHALAYVRGRVHTNGLENYWSLLKRGLKGTYVSAEPFHLFRYLDEQSFRYNNRKKANDGERFKAAMQHISGRRLTYNDLTGKEIPLHQ